MFSDHLIASSAPKTVVGSLMGENSSIFLLGDLSPVERDDYTVLHACFSDFLRDHCELCILYVYKIQPREDS